MKWISKFGFHRSFYWLFLLTTLVACGGSDEQNGLAVADSTPPEDAGRNDASEEDVSVKVSDQGGGIPRSALPRIWTYLYTTAKVRR